MARTPKKIKRAKGNSRPVPVKKTRRSAAVPKEKPPAFSKPVPSPSPWKTAWFHPLQTIRTVLQTNPRQGLPIIAFTYGLTQLIGMAEFRWGEYMELWAIVLVCIVLAWPLGYIAIHVQGWFLEVAGGIMGGYATNKQTTAVVIWGNVTTLINPFLDSFLILMVGKAVFMKNPDPQEVGLWGALIIGIVAVTHLLRIVWSAILIIGQLAEVHQFSRWKAAATLLILYSVGLFFAYLGRIL